MKFSAPMLVVTDLAASRRFYETLLSQKVIFDLGANITFDGGFALQTKPSWLEFIGRDEDALSFGGNSFELYFEEEDFDGFLRRLEADKALEYLCAPHETPWGQRTVRFYDPDRHLIEVGEAMTAVARRFLAQGMTPEQAAERTMYPLDFILGLMRESSRG